MTTAAIRKRLINYITEADDKKIKGMYLLFQEDIERQAEFTLTDEHLRILEEERLQHLNGQTKSYNWNEAKEIIRK